jgi:hypothetical protein
LTFKSFIINKLYSFIFVLITKYRHKIKPNDIPPCYLRANPDFVRLALTTYKKKVNQNKDKTIEFVDDKTFESQNYWDVIQSQTLKTESCKECFLYSVCDGIWKQYVWKFGEDSDLIPIKGEEINEYKRIREAIFGF